MFFLMKNVKSRTGSRLIDEQLEARRLTAREIKLDTEKLLKQTQWGVFSDWFRIVLQRHS
jgi:hypothetical protein